MLQRSILLLLLVLPIAVFSQTGTIKGVVTDAATAETVIGANVVIQGTTVGAATDIDGKFSIANLKPGKYNLQVTFITYKAHLIPDVVVESGKISEIKVQMQEDISELQEIVISGTREINNDISLVNTIRESKLVVSGISAEQIVKLPDNDAAQVMKRVPGITIVDNRFVMVRGVPERYNQVMINNAIAPSTEIDKRSFSFDLIGSNAIDQLLIYKSGAADLPGDFGGGVIQLITKQTSNDDYITFGLGFGYRSNTTNKDFAQSKTGKTDFLGFDRDRALPSDFPSVEELNNADAYGTLREQAGQSLENSFGYSTKKAPVDHGLSFGFARNLDFGRVRASNLTNIGYGRSYQFSNTGYIRYGSFDSDASTRSQRIFDFKDDTYNAESKISVVHNWLVNIGENSKIEFKNFFVQLGENKTTLRSGYDSTAVLGLYNNYGYHYISRSIYSGQLQGQFSSPSERNTVKVGLGYNHVSRNEPDFRRFRTIYDSDRGQFRMFLSPSTNPFDAGRFYSNLNDNGYSTSLAFERRLKEGEEGKKSLLKAGYYAEYKSRTFDARYISYNIPGNFIGGEMEEKTYLPFNQIFASENMYSRSDDGSLTPGFAIREGTRASDSYEGKNMLVSGYVSAQVPVAKFDISGGIRVEHNDQQLISYKGDSVVQNVITSPLPFVNVAYNISSRSLFRIAYSRTVNRPEFRELAPFLFYQFEYNLNVQGKGDLKTASIDNIDLRYEMYPNKGESVSFGVFYKSFTNPIEFVQENASGNLQFSYQNAPKAHSYGVELELRKSLASLGVSRFLRNTSLNLNTSLIRSEVDMGLGAGNSFQQNKRPLQGQSPYVVNLGVYYNDAETGWAMNVGYNIFGNRIFTVGSVLYPSWIERPRHSLDLQVSKSFKNNMEVKLTVQNALNSTYRIYQDNNEDQQIDEKIDDPIQQYQSGTLFSLALGWKIFRN
jgi:TonB-dependent receptor